MNIMAVTARRAVLVFHCLIFSLVSGGVVKRSDDGSIEALQTLLQQQAAAISILEAKVATLGDKVATLSTAGR